MKYSDLEKKKRKKEIGNKQPKLICVYFEYAQLTAVDLEVHLLLGHLTRQVDNLELLLFNYLAQLGNTIVIAHLVLGHNDATARLARHRRLRIELAVEPMRGQHLQAHNTRAAVRLVVALDAQL